MAGKKAEMNKARVARYIDRTLWERLQAYARQHDPVFSATAVLETAIRRFLDEREKGKGK